MTNAYENKSYTYENCLYLIHSFPFLSLLSTVEGLILRNPKEQELGSSFKLFFRFFWAIDYYLTCRYLSRKKKCFAAYNPLLLHVQYLIIKVWPSVCSSSRENCFSPDSRSEAVLEIRARSLDLSKIFRSCGCFNKNYKGYCVWRGTLKFWPTPRAKRTFL